MEKKVKVQMIASYKIEAETENAFNAAMKEIERIDPDTYEITVPRSYTIKRIYITRKILNENSEPEGQ